MLNAIAAESNAVVKAASLVPSVEKNNLNKEALIQLRLFFDLLMVLFKQSIKHVILAMLCEQAKLN